MSADRPKRSKPLAPSSEASAELSSRGAGWYIGLRVWIERAGQSILGPGGLELLEGIHRHRSISAAARQMGMSYRRAWELVQSINEAADEPIVAAVTGGIQGGGAQLTPLGRWAIGVFGEVQAQLHQTASGLSSRLREHALSTLHVAAAVSLEEVVGQLLTDFTLQVPGVRVRAVFGASDELADYLLGGAPGDVFLTADPRQLDRLLAANLVQPEQQVSLAENGLTALCASGAELAIRRIQLMAREESELLPREPGALATGVRYFRDPSWASWRHAS